MLKKLKKHERFIIGGILYNMLLVGINAQIVGAVVPHIRGEFEFSDMLSGFLLSANSAGVLTMSLIASYSAIFLGLKRAYCVQHALIVVGLIIISTTGNPILLMAGMAFLGMGRGSTVNYSFQIANDITKSNPGIMSMMNAFYAVGACVVPFFVIICIGRLGDWRYASFGVAAATAIGITLSTRMKIGKADSKAKEKQRGGYAFFKSKEYWIVLIMVFFYIGMETSVGGWIIIHFMDTHNAPDQLASSMLTVFWATMLFGRLAFSAIANRIKESTLILWLSVGMAVFSALFIWVGGVGMALAATIGMGIFMSAFYSTALASIGSFISEYRVALGFVLTVGGLGAVTMPSVVGIVANQQGVQVGLIILVAASAGLLILAVINHRMKKTQKAD